MKRLTLGDGGCKVGALLLRRRKLELPPNVRLAEAKPNFNLIDSNKTTSVAMN